MPAASAPLRDDERLFSYRQRFQLLRILFAAEIPARQVILSVLEKKLPKPGYTIATLAALSRLCPVKPVIVIGTDQAHNLERWHRADELMRQYEFLVFARRGANMPDLPLLRSEIVADFAHDISATELRRSLKEIPPAHRLQSAIDLLKK